MTMLSFRTDDGQAAEAQDWADRLGIHRSDLLREALRRHLVRLASEKDAETWRRHPLTAEENSLAESAEWGPSEDWADWVDAAR